MLKIQKKLSTSFLALLSLPATAVGFALSTQIAALSWILKTKFNLDVHEVSFVWLAGPLAGIFGQILIGLISDHVWFLGGRRRPFIIIGGIIGALMFLAVPQIGVISEKTGITNIILIASIIALLLDLSINVTFNPARSIIADLTPAGKIRTNGFAWMQIISGTFGVLAYFLSMVFGNEKLLFIATIIVFIFAVVPVLFIEEPKVLNSAKITPEKTFEDSKTNDTNTSFNIFKIFMPLYGFLVFGIFSLIYHFYQKELHFLHNPLLIIAIIYTILIGIWTVISGKRKPSNANEFQKIMLAHTFTWVAFQSMFVISPFFVEEIILKNHNNHVFANIFAEKLTGVTQNEASSTGNIVSLGLLILNAVGAIFPTFLQFFSKNIGRVKTYFSALSFSILGYFYIAFFGTLEINFYIGMFFIGIGWSAVISIVFSIMSERINQAKMGLFMGIFNLAVVLPQMMSHGVGNILQETRNYQLLYIICGISIGLSVIFWFFVKEPQSIENKDLEQIGGAH